MFIRLDIRFVFFLWFYLCTYLDYDKDPINKAVFESMPVCAPLKVDHDIYLSIYLQPSRKIIMTKTTLYYIIVMNESFIISVWL